MSVKIPLLLACMLVAPVVSADHPLDASAPDDVEATETPDGILISWSAPESRDPDGYTIYRVGIDGRLGIIPVGANQTTYLDTVNTTGGFAYFVTAQYGTAQSPPSDFVLVGKYPKCTWFVPVSGPNGIPRGFALVPNCLLYPPAVEPVRPLIESLVGGPVDIPRTVVILW